MATMMLRVFYHDDWSPRSDLEVYTRQIESIDYLNDPDALLRFVHALALNGLQGLADKRQNT